MKKFTRLRRPENTHISSNNQSPPPNPNPQISPATPNKKRSLCDFEANQSANPNRENRPNQPRFSFFQTSPPLNFQPNPPISIQESLNHLNQLQIFLYKADGSLASNNTRFEDLHSESKKILLQIDERIQQYKRESEMLDQCSRFSDASSEYNFFGVEVERIHQKLRGLESMIKRGKYDVQKLMRKVRDVIQNLDAAVNSYRMTRQTPSTFGPSYHANFYGGHQKRPSPFLADTVDRFKNDLIEYRKWIDQNEQLICMDIVRPSSSVSLLQALPPTMSNVHDIFIHLASKVEGLHQTMSSIRKQFLCYRNQQGQETNPFLEAERREIARMKVATIISHPASPLSSSYSLPSNSTPSTQVVFSGFQPQGLSFSTPLFGATVPYFAPAQIMPSQTSTTQFGSIGFSPHAMNYQLDSSGSIQAIMYSQPASGSQFASTPTPATFGGAHAVQSSLFSTGAAWPGPRATSGSSKSKSKHKHHGNRQRK